MIVSIKYKSYPKCEGLRSKHDTVANTPSLKNVPVEVVILSHYQAQLVNNKFVNSDGQWLFSIYKIRTQSLNQSIFLFDQKS